MPLGMIFETMAIPGPALNAASAAIEFLSLTSVPVGEKGAFLTAMGIFQLATALAGGSAALGIQMAKKKMFAT